MVWNIDPGHPGRFANVQMEALQSIPVRRSFLVLLQYLVLSVLVCVVTVYRLSRFKERMIVQKRGRYRV